jgi:AmiR/NasT family two-component response regulator
MVALEDLRAEVSGLRYALTSRTTIDEAKGIIMAERGCDEDTAFLILVLMSQDTNVPLRDVAGAVVYRATGDE